MALTGQDKAWLVHCCDVEAWFCCGWLTCYNHGYADVWLQLIRDVLGTESRGPNSPSRCLLTGIRATRGPELSLGIFPHGWESLGCLENSYNRVSINRSQLEV